MKHFLLTLFILLISASVIAQENLCPTFERAAVAESAAWCSDLSSGQACYGNSGVTAEILSEAIFSTPGDRVTLTDLTRIQSITGDNRYGVSLIQTSGYSPDSWQAQDVNLAILGDVSISNTGNEGINVQVVDARVIGEQGANIRSGPGTEFRLITPLFEDEPIKLTGRSADSMFYRVQLASGETGWIASGAIDANVSDLPVVAVDDTPPAQLYAPFTSFSLETAIDDAACSEAWQSGVLLQSPQDSPVRILVNDIALIVSGTVFLQAEDTRNLVHVIEGTIEYQAEIIQEGYTLAVFDADFSLSVYDIAEFAPLPTEILPRYTYIGIDLTSIITPAPTIDRSPIIDVLVDDPCVITTGQGGANLRAGPGGNFRIRGVLAFRETVNPISRTTGSDGAVWFELAQNVWVSNAVVVTGGDCVSLPQAQRIPVPLPTATPEN